MSRLPFSLKTMSKEEVAERIKQQGLIRHLIVEMHSRSLSGDRAAMELLNASVTVASIRAGERPDLIPDEAAKSAVALGFFEGVDFMDNVRRLGRQLANWADEGNIVTADTIEEVVDQVRGRDRHFGSMTPAYVKVVVEFLAMRGRDEV